MMKMRKLIWMFVLMPLVSKAAVVVDLVEAGSDVIILVTGGVDVSGLTPSGTIPEGSAPQILGAAPSSILLRGAGGTPPLFFGGTASVVQFSNGPAGLSGLLGGPLPTVVNSNTGAVSVSADLIGAPSTTSSSGILPNESFASLGIVDGVVSSTSWSTGSGTESITFRTGSAVVFVPEPSSALMIFGAFLMAGGRRRRDCLRK